MTISTEELSPGAMFVKEDDELARATLAYGASGWVVLGPGWSVLWNAADHAVQHIGSTPDQVVLGFLKAAGYKPLGKAKPFRLATDPADARARGADE